MKVIVLSAELSTLINNSVDKEFTAVVSKIDGFVLMQLKSNSVNCFCLSLPIFNL